MVLDSFLVVFALLDLFRAIDSCGFCMFGRYYRLHTWLFVVFFFLMYLLDVCFCAQLSPSVVLLLLPFLC